MSRTLRMLVLGLLLASAALASSGCGCGVTGGEGEKAVNVSMGGKVIVADRLSFQPVSYGAQRLTIRNTASEQQLELGLGTPITDGQGTTVAVSRNALVIPPGQTGTLVLDRPLMVSGSYYLGAPQSNGRPTIRQLFVCPGSEVPGGGGGVPEVPGVQEPNITE